VYLGAKRRYINTLPFLSFYMVEDSTVMSAVRTMCRLLSDPLSDTSQECLALVDTSDTGAEVFHIHAPAALPGDERHLQHELRNCRDDPTRGLATATVCAHPPLLQCLGQLNLLPPWDVKVSISFRAE